MPAPKTPGTPYAGAWAKKHHYNLLLLNTGEAWWRYNFVITKRTHWRVRMACEKLRCTLSRFAQDALEDAIRRHMADDPDFDEAIPMPKKKRVVKTKAAAPPQSAPAPPAPMPPETMPTEAVSTDEDFGFW
jgi:hypothetical protein